MKEIRWTGQDKQELERLENARNRAKESGRYSDGDYERIQELKNKRLKSRINS